MGPRRGRKVLLWEILKDGDQGWLPGGNNVKTGRSWLDEGVWEECLLLRKEQGQAWSGQQEWSGWSRQLQSGIHGVAAIVKRWCIRPLGRP